MQSAIRDDALSRRRTQQGWRSGSARINAGRAELKPRRLQVRYKDAPGFSGIDDLMALLRPLAAQAKAGGKVSAIVYCLKKDVCVDLAKRITGARPYDVRHTRTTYGTPVPRTERPYDVRHATCRACVALLPALRADASQLMKAT